MNLRKDHYHTIQTKTKQQRGKPVHLSVHCQYSLRHVNTSLTNHLLCLPFLHRKRAYFLHDFENKSAASLLLQTYEQTNSFSNECLGSYNDEERSEMRYVMRIARSASHQNFERSLHFLEKCVCWSVCVSPTLVPASHDAVAAVAGLGRH